MDMLDFIDDSSDEDDLRQKLALRLNLKVNDLPSYRRAIRDDDSFNFRPAERSINPDVYEDDGWEDGVPVRRRQRDAGHRNSQAKSEADSARAAEHRARYQRVHKKVENYANNTLYATPASGPTKRVSAAGSNAISNSDGGSDSSRTGHDDRAWSNDNTRRQRQHRQSERGQRQQHTGSTDTGYERARSAVKDGSDSAATPDDSLAEYRPAVTAFRRMQEAFGDKQRGGNNGDGLAVDFNTLNLIRQQLNREDEAMSQGPQLFGHRDSNNNLAPDERGQAQRDSQSDDSPDSASSVANEQPLESLGPLAPRDSTYGVSMPKTEPRPPRYLLLTLENIPEDMTLQQLIDVFAQYGQIYSARIEPVSGHSATLANSHRGRASEGYRGAICYMPVPRRKHMMLDRIIKLDGRWLKVTIDGRPVRVAMMSKEQEEEQRALDETMMIGDALLPRSRVVNDSTASGQQIVNPPGASWQRFTARSFEIGSEARRGEYLSCWSADSGLHLLLDRSRGRVYIEFIVDSVKFRMDLRCKEAPCWYRIQLNERDPLVDWQDGQQYEADMDTRQYVTLLLRLSRPPTVERLDEPTVPEKPGKGGATYNRDNAWRRIVNIRIAPVPDSARVGPFDVLPHDENRGLVLLGQWLDYRFQFAFDRRDSTRAEDLLDALQNAHSYGMRNLPDNQTARFCPLKGASPITMGASPSTGGAADTNIPSHPIGESQYTRLDLNATYQPNEYDWQRCAESCLYDRQPESFQVIYRLEQYISQRMLPEQALTEEFYNLLADNLANNIAERALINMVQRFTETANPVKLLREELERIESGPIEELDDTALFPSTAPGNPPTEVITNEHISQAALPDYCAVIPRVVITTSKMYVLEPSVETSNRIVRLLKRHANRLLRVQFLEESFYGIHGTTDTHNTIFRRLMTILVRGIRVGGRYYEFLAYSSSQLREFGCWFIAPTEGEDSICADQVRDWMGDFSGHKVIGKMAARMGQCFSSTRSTIELTLDQLHAIPDITTPDQRYTFSDGVGRMSPAVARAVAEKMGLYDPPSAVQFRLGGCKGMLTLHPPLPGIAIAYRDSQFKFSSTHRTLEVIRTANYTVGALNRQIIVLLTSLGIPESAIISRMREYVERFDRSISDPETAIRLLQHNSDEYDVFSRLIVMLRAGLLEVREPYLVNMLRVFRISQLRELKRKSKIPLDNSVMLLGVMDEFGVLEENEVFVQYDHPTREQPFIPTGQMIVTRNPCFHPGDIRIVTAVDHPRLRHLRNLIVFSQKGSRDIPGQCSGGDLDGDEFTCIWDEELLPQDQYPPMDFTPLESPKQDNILIRDVKRFFVNYILNDNLGMIANAHLAQADQLKEGARHGICLRLAQLHSIAVDYPKSGAPAIFDRALRPRAYPHFMEKHDKEMYHSQSVLGKIYDAVTLEDFQPERNIKLDTRMLADCHDVFLSEARTLKRKYDLAITGVMQQFGIGTEWEVITGCVIRYTDAIQRRDYHLRQLVMELVQGIELRFRSHFVEEFLEDMVADGLDVSSPTDKPVNVRLEDLMRAGAASSKRCTQRRSTMLPMAPPHIRAAMRSKASAWYYVTYDPAERELAGEFSDRFSFPWLVYEHLCEQVLASQRTADDHSLEQTLAASTPSD